MDELDRTAVMKIEQYSQRHRPGAAQLWQDIFGDDRAYIDYFLTHLPGVGAVAAEGDRVAAMAFVLTGIECQGKSWGYLYAVATDPAFRGRGLGEAVCRAAAEWSGADALCTLPAEEGLRKWYSRILSLDNCLYMKEETVPACSEPMLTPISPEAYAARRETLLTGIPHAVFQPEHCRLLESLCRVYGGGLYSWEGGILAGYPADGALRVQEALGENTDCAAGAMAFRLGLSRAVMRKPAQAGEKFLAVPSGSLQSGTLWGLTFD